jgi:hypothetical protein
MKDVPNIAAIAALPGDPARADMLTALMHGEALAGNEPSAGRPDPSGSIAPNQSRSWRGARLLLCRSEPPRSSGQDPTLINSSVVTCGLVLGGEPL